MSRGTTIQIWEYVNINSFCKPHPYFQFYLCNIHVDEEHSYGATLIHKQFILTAVTCASQTATSGFVTVLLGQHIRTPMGLIVDADMPRIL